MVLKLLKAGTIHGVPKGSLARGDLASHKGAVMADVNDAPFGILLDTVSTDDPNLMVDLYGEGSVIDDSTLTLDENSLVYSDGDGTWSTSKPAGAAGTKIWVIGHPFSATAFTMHIYSIEKGA
jgi:hypothetical protein